MVLTARGVYLTPCRELEGREGGREAWRKKRGMEGRKRMDGKMKKKEGRKRRATEGDEQ